MLMQDGALLIEQNSTSNDEGDFTFPVTYIETAMTPVDASINAVVSLGQQKAYCLSKHRQATPGCNC